MTARSIVPASIDQISKVYVNPQSKVKYISYYLEGLYRLIGRGNVRFASHPFRDIEVPNPWTAYEHYAAFVFITRNNRHIRVVIDFHDSRIHIPEAYVWCDVYAKVNLDLQTLPPEDFPKVVPIAPFAFTRIWDKNRQHGYLLANFIRCGFKPNAGRKRFKRDYSFMSACMSINEYESARSTPIEEEPNSRPYIFLIGSLWHHTFCLAFTNPWRRRFMEACQQLPCTFEGGFYAYNGDHPERDAYAHLMLERKYSIPEYFSRMARSIIAFNTPAVHECHGVKLVEFLAMGKAIVSTPITNVLPGPGLVHGKSIHIVHTEEELREAIMRMIKDKPYREAIASGAREYYNNFVAPAAAIRNLSETDVFLACL